MPLGVSPLDSALQQGRLWTPEVLRGSGNLCLFVEAYDISTISIGTGVAEWRDKSGRNNHPVQSTGGTQPAWNQEAVLTAGSKYLQSAATNNQTSFPDLQTGIMTFVAIYNSGITLMKYENPSDLGGSNRIGIEAASRVDWPNDTAASAGGKLESWSEGLSTTYKICSIRRTASGKTVRINGLQVASDTNTSTLTLNGTFAFSVGADPGGSNPADMGMKAWIMTAKSDKITEEQIEGYLAWRTGITLAASHPYRNAPPTIGG